MEMKGRTEYEQEWPSWMDRNFEGEDRHTQSSIYLVTQSNMSLKTPDHNQILDPQRNPHDESSTEKRQSIMKFEDTTPTNQSSPAQMAPIGNSKVHYDTYNILNKLISNLKEEVLQSASGLFQNSTTKGNACILQQYNTILSSIEDSKIEIGLVFDSLDKFIDLSRESRFKMVKTLNDHIDMIEAGKKIKIIVEAIRQITAELVTIKREIKEIRQTRAKNYQNLDEILMKQTSVCKQAEQDFKQDSESTHDLIHEKLKSLPKWKETLKKYSESQQKDKDDEDDNLDTTSVTHNMKRAVRNIRKILKRHSPPLYTIHEDII